jgi:hypothetical protein
MKTQSNLFYLIGIYLIVPQTKQIQLEKGK